MKKKKGSETGRPNKMTDRQMDTLAKNLERAWKQYTYFFDEPPHGTLKQLRAMMEFLPIDPLNELHPIMKGLS